VQKKKKHYSHEINSTSSFRLPFSSRVSSFGDYSGDYIMKTDFKEIQQFKIDGDKSYIDGAYWFKHPKITGYIIQVIASCGLGWDHVSVSLLDNRRGKARLIDKVERCPTWPEMCHVKNLFFDKDETVIQYHPPEESYVNNHQYCLHLWKPQTFELPVPERILVGV
jgi:hypothetical protein